MRMGLGFCWVVGWMVSAVAWAQPPVSAHPLTVEKGPRGERWNALFMREFAAQNVAMTPEVVVEGFLQRYEGSCKGDMDCLQQLGYATQAYYVLDGHMSRKGDVYTAGARVIRVDGLVVKEVGPLEVERVSNTSEEANARAVYSKLFAALKLEALPAHPFAIKPPPNDEPPPAFVPPPPDGRLRTASYSLLGCAGAGVVAGSVSALLANSNHKNYKKRYSTDDTRVLYADVDPMAAQKLSDKVRTQKTVAIVSFSVATAAAIAGATLLFVSPTPQKNKVAKLGLAPTADGFLLSLHGNF